MGEDVLDSTPERIASSYLKFLIFLSKFSIASFKAKFNSVGSKSLRLVKV